MSRISRGNLPAGGNVPAAAVAVPSALLRRGKALAGVSTVEGEDTLDLFSKTRGGCLFSSSGGSDVLNRMEKKVSIGLAKAGRGAADEFLSVEVGKHDYDWLLTPPGTPFFSSVDSTDHLPSSTSQRSSSNLRSASLVKTSRLSVPQSENNSHCPRMARSSSTTRASFSTSSRTPSSVLNTSTASVNSRPATPNTRARTPATAAPRTTASRSTTPSRTRPSPIEKPKPFTQTSRPSTPNSKAHFPASSTVSSSLNYTQTRPSVRASTPTRRPPPPTNSRPSSPTPRTRAQAQPIIPPDYPFDAPPNLRTKLPERAISAGRQRPGAALTVKGNSNMEAAGSEVSSSRRALSPAGARGRVVDNQAKGRVNGSRDNPKLVENQKPMVPERKPVKPSLGAEIGGYGRTMSKNSLNMALKHMDIRRGAGGVRGPSLFPHSIRSSVTATLKDRPSSRLEPVAAAHKKRITDYGGYHNELMPKNNNESSSEIRDGGMISYREVGPTMKDYGSSRYDSILLKEDSRSLNWLHSLDDKPDDQSHPFDRSRFEPLPEPFILL